MEFERYYLDLFEVLNSLCKKIASGKYDQSDVDKLFDMATLVLTRYVPHRTRVTFNIGKLCEN